MTTVRFEQHDLQAVRMARRALLLVADFLDEVGGYRGPRVGLALDDLQLLADRMQEQVDGLAENVVSLDTHSRRG
jgi:hypothetical protein